MSADDLPPIESKPGESRAQAPRAKQVSKTRYDLTSGRTLNGQVRFDHATLEELDHILATLAEMRQSVLDWHDPDPDRRWRRRAHWRARDAAQEPPA